MKSISYRKDIDALRGISILLVVIYHAFPGFIPGGFVGVDVFFIISGYLITGIITKQLDNNIFSFLEFYKRRIQRILPSLLTVVFASLFIGWFILYTDEYKQLGDHAFHSILFIQNFALINELGYFDVSVIIPFLTAAKSRCHAAFSMCFGGKPPLALLGRSLL